MKHSIDITKLKSVHMIGIGGVGMSGLAKYLHAHGVKVSGSDTSSSKITKELKHVFGIHVVIGSKAEHVSSQHDLLIYSPAVLENDSEREAGSILGIQQLSYPEILGVLSTIYSTVTVSGTNGKTTTTSMIVELLDYLGAQPQAIVGATLQKYNSNYVNGLSDLFVVEACEYKDSFLNISHDVAVITNIDEDHLDYFKNLQHIQESFSNFLDNKKGQGVLVCDPSLTALAPVITKAQSLGMKIIDYTKYLEGLELRIAGEHNRKNAAASLAVIDHLSLDISKALEYLRDSFLGAQRRFEIKGYTQNKALVIDDYAHNPEGIRLLIEAIRSKYEGKNIVLLFEPHLYSRTRDFKLAFAEALSQSDELYLFETYKAREPYQENEKFLLEEYIDRDKVMVNTVTDPKNFLAEFSARNYGPENVIVTAGAGDIWTWAEKITS